MAEERFYPYNNKKLAERLGVSFITLKRWIYQGKVKAVKTNGRRYRIPESEMLRIMGKKKEPLPRNRAVVYARVSSYDQVKDGDLDGQLEHLRGYASKRDCDIKKDATQELVENLISVVQSFSTRLYERRSHEDQKVVGGLKSAFHV